MGREFVWIDESYDQLDYDEGKFYMLGAVKVTVEGGQITNDLSKSGNIKGFIPLDIVRAYKSTMRKIKNNNKSRTEKKKIRIPELHEANLFTNNNTRIVKSWFIEEFIKCENIEIYYVFFESNAANVSELKAYKLMLKKLLKICNVSNDSQIILDLCMDQHGDLKEQSKIIEFLRDKVGIKEPHQIKFMESDANYGLQVVDIVIGTIRRKLHKEKKDEQNFKSIEPFIVSFERLYEKDFKEFKDFK